MCGITGYCSFKSEFEDSVIVDMTKSMTHRGPDSDGTFVHKEDSFKIALGHSRLSIIDLSDTGSQPMHRSGYLSIVFNGEIYNFREVQHDLEKRGHNFVGHSDTEVILAAYQEWGVQCVNKFHGMFAFCLVDLKSRKVYLVRDRVGSKPLYYYWNSDLLIFGSELKAVMKHPGFRKQINHSALQEFLKYSYIPGPYSIFENTWKVMPGHVITIEIDEKRINDSAYWEVIDSYNKEKLNITYDESVNLVEEVLVESFKYRMVSDVPVGLFLSGGYDSTAVAGILQSNSSSRIKSYTIGFNEAEFNEAVEAKKIANYLGTDHNELYIGPDDVSGVLTELPVVYDEPFADNSVVPTLLVSKFARNDVKVVLSGDGGDEIFGGYNKFSQAINLSTRIPLSVQTLISSIMRKIPPEKIPFYSRIYNFQSRYHKIANIWSTHSPYEALKNISQYITAIELQDLLVKTEPSLTTNFDIHNQLNNENDKLNKLLAIDYLTFLVDNNLVKVDRAGMSVGLECREPFLDQKVIELVSNLPSHYKIRNGVTKSLLKDVVHKYVPKPMMERPKKPFVAPLAIWFKNEINDLLQDHLTEDILIRQGIFNPGTVHHLKNSFLNGENISFQKVWNILVFQLWYKKWMN